MLRPTNTTRPDGDNESESLFFLFVCVAVVMGCMYAGVMSDRRHNRH